MRWWHGSQKRRRLAAIDRTISPNDRLAPLYALDDYIASGLYQANQLDRWLQTYAGVRLEVVGSIADYACHYGRLIRALRVAAPQAKLYAYDIDPEAARFCAELVGAEPVVAGWEPERLAGTAAHDLIVCVSLATHTDARFLERLIALWRTLLAPGGLLVFTYLSERFIPKWLAGKLDHYASVEPATKAAQAAAFKSAGHCFASNPTAYGGGGYGIGFISDRSLTELVTPPLRLCELVHGSGFGQDVAIFRKA